MRPQSDVDLLAAIEPPMTAAMRASLVAGLLRTSGRHPRAAGQARPVELIVFLRDQLAMPAFPACCEFVYGEWLRDAFETGATAMPQCDPEFTLLLAQARGTALPLAGPALNTLLREITATEIRRAMRDMLPQLLANLHGDERNVLLTLARMWRTAAMGGFVAKDEAARWAAERMPDGLDKVLVLARDAYLALAEDDWQGREAAAGRTADYLAGRIRASLTG